MLSTPDWHSAPAALSAVIARFKRANQYAVAVVRGRASAAAPDCDDTEYWVLRVKRRTTVCGWGRRLGRSIAVVIDA
ncbi:hypothetical protein DB459_26635 [Bradyrhizobium sp. WD16]|nr:hypothetical protein DB459_26635 [Bradyrhizobium sp. WD16]